MPTSRKTFLKQAGFAMAGAALPFSKSLGAFFNPPTVKTVDEQHPKDCSKDLRTPLFSVSLLTTSDYTYYKSGFAIKDVLYEAEENILITTNNPKGCVTSIGNPPGVICDATDHHFYTANDPDNDISLLRYRVFHPISTNQDATNGHDYVNKPLPCVVLFHPGGFQECPDYLPPGIVTVCKQLALRGYIAITVGYRGGRIKDADASKTSIQQQIAPYRALQDGRGAIRSIIKRNNANTTDNHRQNFIIDESQFFVGGLSAGAITAVGIAYYRSQTLINQAFFFQSGPNLLSIQGALGHINADYYYGEPGTDLNNPTYWPVIRGVLNCWGGITIPKIRDSDEYNFFKGTSGLINPPIIGFAGAKDPVVPFKDDFHQDFLNSTDAPYQEEKNCLNGGPNMSIKLQDPGMNNTIFVKQGSALNLYYILKDSTIDRFTELYIDCNMLHGIQKPSRDNFGVYVAGPNNTNIATADDVYTYIAIRAAIFFQTIMNYPSTTSFPKYGYRGKALFVSTSDTTDATNQRTCTDCDGDPVGDTCLPSEDPLCN